MREATFILVLLAFVIPTIIIMFTISLTGIHL